MPENPDRKQKTGGNNVKEYLANKAAGFYLTAAAAVAALAGIFVYGTVMYKFTPVYVLLAAAVVVEVAAVVLRIKRLSEVIPVINAVLTASAAVWSAMVMVNQIGYVIASLDPVSTITSYIVYLAVAIAAMLINIVAAFMNQEKEMK